jgi:hypothetical protein
VEGPSVPLAAAATRTCLDDWLALQVPNVDLAVLENLTKCRSNHLDPASRTGPMHTTGSRSGSVPPSISSD